MIVGDDEYRLGLARSAFAGTRPQAADDLADGIVAEQLSSTEFP
ncbi:MAG TPA: hypothetical protein PKW66_23835 [Polyangiaceae bacterium]|nr:hypothetical protein [Polyangiaceae bacterium]